MNIQAGKTPEEMQQKLQEDPDFVCLRRYGYSVNKVLEKYPNGVPDHIIADGLMMTENELEERYKAIVTCLRARIGA